MKLLHNENEKVKPYAGEKEELNSINFKLNSWKRKIILRSKQALIYLFPGQHSNLLRNQYFLFK